MFLVVGAKKQNTLFKQNPFEFIANVIFEAMNLKIKMQFFQFKKSIRIHLNNFQKKFYLVEKDWLQFVGPYWSPRQL